MTGSAATADTDRFLAALRAAGPAPGRAGAKALYGRFVGCWALDVTEFPPGGAERRRPGEWHFGWVLEGRAVRDVWIVPARPGTEDPGYDGTTPRTWDPRVAAWGSVPA